MKKHSGVVGAPVGGGGGATQVSLTQISPTTEQFTLSQSAPIMVPTHLVVIHGGKSLSGIVQTKVALHG